LEPSCRNEDVFLNRLIAGTVQPFAPKAASKVDMLTDALMTIVPDQGGVMREAKVKNEDIGFAQAGHGVDIRVPPCTVTWYGLLNDHSTDISRDTAPTNLHLNRQAQSLNTSGRGP
jgi:hypothetical protein